MPDCDPTFLSNFWKEFFKHQGSKLCHSSAYHPQSDGQTEVLNRTLEHYLRCFSADKPSKWSSFLPWAEWWYNTTYQSAIKMSPFQALYRVTPPSVHTYLPGTTAVQSVDAALQDRDQLLRLLRNNVQLAQNRMKQIHDKGRTEQGLWSVIGYFSSCNHIGNNLSPCTIPTNWRLSFMAHFKFRNELALWLIVSTFHMTQKSTLFFMFPCLKRRLVQRLLQIPPSHRWIRRDSSSGNQKKFWTKASSRKRTNQ